MREFGTTREEEVVFIDGRQIFEENRKVQAFREENSGQRLPFKSVVCGKA